MKVCAQFCSVLASVERPYWLFVSNNIDRKISIDISVMLHTFFTMKHTHYLKFNGFFFKLCVF